MTLKALPLLLLFTAATTACHERSLTRRQLSSLGRLEVVVCNGQTGLEVQSIPIPTPVTSAPVTGISDKNTAAMVSSIGSALQNIGQSMDHSYRTRRLQEHAAPLTQQLTAYDFKADLLEATKVEFAKVNAVSVELQPAIANTYCTESVRQGMYDQSTADAVLVYAVDYSLRDAYGPHPFLTFTGQAAIYAKANALWEARRAPDPANPVADGSAVYKRTFEYEFPYDPKKRSVSDYFRQAAYSLVAKLTADLNKP